MRILPTQWIRNFKPQYPPKMVMSLSSLSTFMASYSSVRFSSDSTMISLVISDRDKHQKFVAAFKGAFTTTYQQQTLPFSSCSALCKHKKSFKYDPKYVKPQKKKEKKKNERTEKVGLDNITWENENDIKLRDMTKLTSAELEEQHEPLPDEDLLIEAFTVKSSNRSGVVSKDAEISLRGLVDKYPKLKHHDGTEFVKYMEFMTMYGFHPEKAVQMLLRHPPLLTNHNKRVNESMLTWRSMGYTEKTIIEMLNYYPQLVEQPSLDTRERFGFLTSYFSREETMFAILNCVNVLYDDEGILKKKLEYLIMSLCHTTRSIVRSLALTYSLKHMKIRHEFLIRAGLFQKDNYYAQHKKLYMINPRMPRNKYFSPTDTICTNDADFLRICTDNMLTLNELAAFEELYFEELERDKLLMSDDEDSEESEDSESDEDEGDGEETEHLLGPAFGANNSSAFFNKKDCSDFYY